MKPSSCGFELTPLTDQASSALRSGPRALSRLTLNTDVNEAVASALSRLLARVRAPVKIYQILCVYPRDGVTIFTSWHLTPRCTKSSRASSAHLILRESLLGMLARRQILGMFYGRPGPALLFILALAVRPCLVFLRTRLCQLGRPWSLIRITKHITGSKSTPVSHRAYKSRQLEASQVWKSNMFFELNLQLARSSQIKCSMHANQCSKP